MTNKLSHKHNRRIWGIQLYYGNLWRIYTYYFDGLLIPRSSNVIPTRKCNFYCLVTRSNPRLLGIPAHYNVGIYRDNYYCAWPKREDFSNSNSRPILFYRTVLGYIVAIFYSRAPQRNTYVRCQRNDVRL